MTSTNVRAMFELGASGHLNPCRSSDLARTLNVLVKCNLPGQPPQNRAPNGAVRGLWSYQLEHEHPYIGKVNVRVAKAETPGEGRVKISGGVGRVPQARQFSSRVTLEE